MRHWILAARIRTLPAAIAPVILGCAICEKPHLLAALSALIGAILIQIGTNFANDYFDFVNGADNDERIGPTRATQAGLITPKQMKTAFLITFALTIPIISYLTMRGGWPIVWIGILSIASGILYTGGPKPLGYMGLGDIFVLIFFGPVAVAGTAYVQTLQWSNDAIIIGLASGLFSTAILIVNNLRDVESDGNVGKNTLVVRFGATFARWEYSLCIVGATVITIYYALDRNWIFLACISSILSIPIIRSMWTETGKDLDPNLAKTAKLLVLYSVLFSIGWTIG
jgi:1,4-dihydroxy-2-naphthoate polyprenyltransferase